MTSYADITPLTDPIPADRQGARRHYGVHPYFTRRPYNVVRGYILQYTREGDTVLDPYGGSGVTAIEAFLQNRIGIQNDINPLANFVARGIADLAHGKGAEYRDALTKISESCGERVHQIEQMNERNLAKVLKTVPLPENVALPSTADASALHDLFYPKQLAALATIKKAIFKIKSRQTRSAMLLAFSATLTKVNKTFLSAEGRAESRGGSSIFSIYRYKVAKEPVQLPIWDTFYERARNVLDAKDEVDEAIELKQRTTGWRGKFEALSMDVLELPKKLKAKVDYIFTDPPYGAHISYLDLSTMWNAWLGTLPGTQARRAEIIVGGDLKHTEEWYVERLGQSIVACVQMLKRNRWMSVVFQHWNVTYFQAILRAAAEAGADLRAAVSQIGDPIWSMHKKKGSESVLAGELILTFFNTGRAIAFESGRQFDLEKETLRILKQHGEQPFYGEYLLNRLIVDAWHRGAIDSLSLSKDSFCELLTGLGWQYSESQHTWQSKSERAATSAHQGALF